MNLIELTATREALRKTLREYDRITPACDNCIRLEPGNRCGEFNANPPPEWITGPVTCQKWHYDNVPF